MNKKDFLPILVLVLLIPIYSIIDRKFIAPKFPAKTPAPVEQTAETTPVGNIENATISAPTAEPVEAVQAKIKEVVKPLEKEVVQILENDKVSIELTSFGGGIKSATFIAEDKNGEPLYPTFNEKGSDPVKLDFSASTALAYEGLEGITATDSLALQSSTEPNTILFSKQVGDLTFERVVSVDENYLLTIKDRFVNTSKNPVELPPLRILTGTMTNPEGMKAQKGVSILGVDTFTANAQVNYWGRKISGLFKEADKAISIDSTPEDMLHKPVSWVSTKNKFFTQILQPAAPVATFSILSNRDPLVKGLVPTDIRAALAFKPQLIPANGQHEINYSYYIGPMKFSTLHETGHSMEKVMEFETTGFFSFMNWLMEPVRQGLLYVLNFFNNTVPGGYGIAIILLTLLVRIIFWPLTHKSTAKMAVHTKKMQAVQPEIKAIQEKYKSNPQRMQKETMLLYKEKGVNPMGAMGGCLPMVVQIPIFIALFTVLRNAIELRYAGFLWISDLSMAENLFESAMPAFLGGLNILPLLMSASMILQQRMTPQMATTPEQQQQQKMMMFMMPIMMLFFFYKMSAGLVLYWTTSNVLMILQTYLRNQKEKKKDLIAAN